MSLCVSLCLPSVNLVSLCFCPALCLSMSFCLGHAPLAYCLHLVNSIPVVSGLACDREQEPPKRVVGLWRANNSSCGLPRALSRSVGLDTSSQQSAALSCTRWAHEAVWVQQLQQLEQAPTQPAMPIFFILMGIQREIGINGYRCCDADT